MSWTGYINFKNKHFYNILENILFYMYRVTTNHTRLGPLIEREGQEKEKDTVGN